MEGEDANLDFWNVGEILFCGLENSWLLNIYEIGREAQTLTNCAFFSFWLIYEIYANVVDTIL